MTALIIILAYTLLPPGFPFMPLLGGVLLIRGSRLNWPATNLWLQIVIAWFALLLVGAQSMVSVVQLLACLSSLAIFALVDDEKMLDRISRTVLIFSIFNLFIIALFLTGTAPSALLDWMFVYGDAGGLRYRFVFSEPNHMAFFLFFMAVISQQVTQSRSILYQSIVGIGLFLSAMTSGSPVAYIGLFAYAVPYFLRAPVQGKIISLGLMSAIVILLLVFTPENVAYRIDLLMYGQDNSFNLRTWGSFQIAKDTLEAAGMTKFGGGIGSARSLLFGNPYMYQFAASQESTLPSFLGTMFIEGGYYSLIGLAIALGGIIYLSRRMLLALIASMLLVAHLLSSSFFYDSISWTALGLIYNFIWQKTRQERMPK